MQLPAFVIFETGGSAATPEQLAAWQAFTQTLADQPVDPAKPDLGVIGDYFVDSPVPGQPVPVPLIPSEDGQAALVLVPLSADKVTTVDAEGKDPLGDVIDGIRTAAEASAAGAEVHIAGPAGLIADLGAAFAGIDGLLLLVALSARAGHPAPGLPGDRVAVRGAVHLDQRASRWPVAWSTCWPRTTSSR